MKKLWKLLLFVTITAMTLTACGGASKSADSAAVMTTAAAAMAPAAGAVNGSYKSEMGMAETIAYMEEAEMDAGSSLTTSAGIDPVADLGRKLIRTIHMDVETEDFDVLIEKLNQQISALAGYVEQSDISGKSIQNDYSRRRAYMTVRIPSTKLNQFVDSVEDNGNVTNKSETTTDVTLQYSDLESRKKSLTIEQDRIWALLEKADTLESVIALEERLSEIRYELEAMESKLRLYDNQVDYSTVYINIEEVKTYTPTAPLTIGERIEKGFTRNVENMKNSAIDFIVWAASSTPILIPLLAVVIAAVLILRKVLAKKNVKNIASKLPSEFKSDSSSDETKK